MYFILFNGVTDVIEQLKKMQAKTEELYIESEKAPLTIIKNIGADERERSSADAMDAHHPSGV